MFLTNKLEVFHTTENKGNFEDLLVSKGVYANTNDLFLGKGFYYWEGCFDHAKQMGITKYPNKYYIFKGQLMVDYNKLFNLSFNNHIQFLIGLSSKLGKRGEKLKIGQLIDFVRDIEKKAIKDGCNEPFFPFYYSIAVDITGKPTVSNRFEFSSRLPNYINVKPESIICVYDKKNLSLEEFQLIKEENGNK
jgi:hypothetical protein